MKVEEIQDTRNKILASASADAEPLIVASFEIAAQLCRIADALDDLNNMLPLTIREESSNLTETIRRKIL